MFPRKCWCRQRRATGWYQVPSASFSLRDLRPKRIWWDPCEASTPTWTAGAGCLPAWGKRLGGSFAGTDHHPTPACRRSNWKSAGEDGGDAGILPPALPSLGAVCRHSGTTVHGTPGLLLQPRNQSWANICSFFSGPCFQL